MDVGGGLRAGDLNYVVFLVFGLGCPMIFMGPMAYSGVLWS